MKNNLYIYLSICLFTTGFCTPVFCQLGEVEGLFRVTSITPTFELYDSYVFEDRVEAVLKETNDNIHLYSTWGNLTLGAGADGQTTIPKHLTIKHHADKGLIGINVEDPSQPLQIKRDNSHPGNTAIGENYIRFRDDDVSKSSISKGFDDILRIENLTTPASENITTISIETRKNNGDVHRPFLTKGNGNIGIGEKFYSYSPTSSIHLRHRFSNTDPRHDGVKIENAGANGYYFTMYVVNASNDLELYTGQSVNPVGRFDAVTGVYSSLSDARNKENIEPIENALDKITALNPVTYHFKHDSIQDKRSFGLLAQELAEVFPELVEKSENMDVNLVDYTSMIPYLIKAIQEQSNEINLTKDYLRRTIEFNQVLKARVEALETRLYDKQ